MKISIITASYNYERYIGETIESVLNQTYSDWELIIVDDGSKDNSVELIKSYVEKDPRIKLFTHENNKNKGLKETLKLGIEKAESEWIAFLESDDMWREDYLEKKAEIAQKYPEVVLISNDCEFFGNEDRVQQMNRCLKPTRNWLCNQKYPKNFFYDLYLGNKIFTFSCAMLKKSALKDVNIETPIDCLIDWWLWIQLSYNTKFYFIPEKLTKWRLENTSYISKSPMKSPFDLQFRAYWDIMVKNKIYYILPWMIVMNIPWAWRAVGRIPRNIKVLIRELIKEKF